MNKNLLLSLLVSLSMLCANAYAQKPWGTTPKLTVEGNHLVDPDGNQVMLHGVMDTPSPYFSGYRFTDGHPIDVYKQGDDYITKCTSYFTKLFNAITDTTQGSWCNVFRLHLDPCWTDNPNVNATGFTTKNGKTYDPNGTEVSGEANIIHFSKQRLTTYLNTLYMKIAKIANNKGLYVIMRPPGVCPSTIKVGDYYQKYLIDVWDVVTKNSNVKNYSDWLSLELANEPVAILDANGNRTDAAKRDFFQPIIDKIRANGFKGIIWVPGETWQQEYRSYVNYPVKDELNNMGYAVHFYPGWYNTSDNSYDANTTIRSFANSVPVVKTHPIMITEVDWSPEHPGGNGHYNESGQWVKDNYGTWATGSTSKFGKAYKAMLEYYDNIGMTLTHTHDYIDIDTYLSTGKLYPRWSNMVGYNGDEACSGACFKWYPEFAAKKHEARDFSVSYKYYFDEKDELKNAAANLNGKVLAITDEMAKNFWYVNSSETQPQDVKTADMSSWAMQNFKYMKFTKVTNSGCSTTGYIYEIQFCDVTGSVYNLWGDNGYLNAQPSGNTLFALGLNNQYGTDGKYCALWKIDYEAGHGYTLMSVGRKEKGTTSYVTPNSTSPQPSKVYVRLFTAVSEVKPTAVKNITDDMTEIYVTGIYDVSGRKISKLSKGLNIVRYSNGMSKKVWNK